MSNILLLGAGASFGARANQQHRPPLGKQLLQFIRKNCVAIMDRQPGGSAEIHESRHILEKALRICRQNRCTRSFEKLLPNLKIEERIIIHRAVQILFSDLYPVDIGFRSQKDLYDDLITRCFLDNNSWIVISLNYDRLFEEALDRARLKYYYPHFNFGIAAQTGTGTPIYKPHGSINFFAKADYQYSYVAPPLAPGKSTKIVRNSKGNIAVQQPMFYSVLPGAANVLHETFSEIPFPVIANFTYGKEGDINERELLEIRKEVLGRSTCQSRLLVVGVNPLLQPGDDPFIEELFKLPFKTVEYVDASEQAANQIGRIFPHAIVYSSGLSGYLSRQK